jgi:PAS domain S-box-containing protein
MTEHEPESEDLAGANPRLKHLWDYSEQLRQQTLRLRASVAEARDENARLTRELAEAREGSCADREARRAALNLMEDAVQARESAQRENAERLRAERERRASEEKYRTLFESIDEGFFILEKLGSRLGEALDFRFVEANPAAGIQAGVGPVVGKTMRQVFAGESEEWYTTFDRVLATGESIRCERELVTRSRVVELYAFRVLDRTSSRIAVIFKDISDRKAAEAARREADRRKDEFLATLAHEIRNPLATICNSLTLMGFIAGDDPGSRDVCAMMQRQVNQMARLVDDLMEVSRITRGVVELKKEQTDLATIVRNAVETNRPLIESLGHHLTVLIPQTPVALDGDVVRLGQVLGNLLDNAAKHTDPGGEIGLSASLVNTRVEISVRDSGIGIPPSLMPVIFDIFTRGDRNGNRAQGGLGIGLTLVKKLVEMHGGSILARSEGPGHGSEFILRLPVAHRNREARGAPADGPSRALVNRRRVLVVDDNEDSATSFSLLLKSLGSDVRTTYNGAAALELLKSYRPDVVFLDLGMPGMDGCTVAQRIRQHAELERVTLVALTGWGQDEDQQRTRAAGFDHHLVKPADLAAVQSLLAGDRE